MFNFTEFKKDGGRTTGRNEPNLKVVGSNPTPRNEFYRRRPIAQ